MSFLWVSARKDLLRFSQDPTALLIWIGIPLLIGTLMTLATGGRSGPSPKAKVLVADHDGAFLSGLLVGALSQDAAGGFASAEEVTEEEGRARMADGEASALLVIPEGFSLAVLKEEPTELLLVTNPAQRILPGIVEEALSTLADAVFYVHRLIGDDLVGFAEGPPTDAEIADFSVRVNRTVERMEDLLFPPAIELETAGGEAPDEDEPGGYALLFVPGLLMMSLLFMAQGLSEDLWRERAQATLRRVLAAPPSVHAFLFGKALAGAAAMALVCLVALTAAFAWFGVPFGRLPLAVGWSVLSGVFLLGAMMLVQLLASSQRAGGVLSLALVFPLMMMGGSFFPFEAMPAWMAAVGRRTPNGWSVTVLGDVLAGEATAPDVARGTAVLVLAGALVFLLAARRMRRAFAVG